MTRRDAGLPVPRPGFIPLLLPMEFATPWTVAYQAPLSMEFSRQDTGMGCYALLQGNLPNPGIEPVFPELAGGFFTTGATWEAQGKKVYLHIT